MEKKSSNLVKKSSLGSSQTFLSVIPSAQASEKLDVLQIICVIKKCFHERSRSDQYGKQPEA